MATPKQKTIDTIMQKLTLHARNAGYVQIDSEGQTRRRLERQTLSILTKVLEDVDSGSYLLITPKKKVQS